MRNYKTRGFTIVELLIVIVVIGILAAITIVAFNGIQTKARDTSRINDLKVIQKAVEAYNAINGSYPIGSSGSGAWSGYCPSFGNATTYIIGVDQVISSPLPLEKKFSPSTNQCYVYRSNGTDYIALAYRTMETICGGDPSNSCNSDQIRAMDRASTVAEPSIGVWSPGGAGW